MEVKAFLVKTTANLAAVRGSLIAGFTVLFAAVASTAGTAAPPFRVAAVYDSGGEFAISVVVGDLNGDGKLDIVTANFLTNNIGVLLNNGDGTYQSVVDYVPGGIFAQGVALADVNGDGTLDLLVVMRCIGGNCDGLARVLLGNGDGTFRPALLYPSGGIVPWAVASADVNHDGRPDLLVVNESSNTIGVLLGNGDGSFQTALTYGSGGASPRSVAAADVNRDGIPDLVVANRCDVGPNCSPIGNGSVGVLLGNGDGSFQAAVSYAEGIGPISVVLADVNGDGAQDILVAGPCALDDCSVGSVGVLLGRGDGTFEQAINYSSIGLGTSSVAVADVDGDGAPDLIAASLCGVPCGEGSVALLLGVGDGTFEPAVVFSSGAFGARSVAVADVDGDTVPDLVVANEGCPGTVCAGASVSVLLNNLFIRVSIDVEPGKFPNRINVHSHEIVRVALLASDTFDVTAVDGTTVRFGPAGARPDRARPEDIDGDGRLDLVFSFRGNQTGLTCSDASATLEGITNHGARFVGIDSIAVLGCKSGK